MDADPLTGGLAARIAALSPAKRALLERELAARGAGGIPGAASPVSAAGPRAPLTPAQQRLWIMAHLEPATVTYHRLFALRLAGPLDVLAMEAALRDVVERHEALRTQFGSVEGEPYQEIGPVPSVLLPVVDAGGATSPSEAEIASLVRPPFDLRAGCLLRTRLLRYAPDDHSLLLCTHHLVSDGWSDGIVAADLMACYRARTRAEPRGLPSLPLRFIDVAASLAADARAAGGAEDRFWHSQLRAPLPDVRLAADHARRTEPDAVPSGDGRLAVITVDHGFTEAIDALARGWRVTPFSVWLTGYLWGLRQTVLVAPESGEILVTTPSAGRSRTAWEPLVGFFAHTLLLRIPLPDDATFAETVQVVHQQMLAAVAHQDAPVETALKALPARHRRSVTSLVPIGFGYQNTPPAMLAGGNVDARAERLDPGTAKTHLTMYVWRETDTTTLGLEYASDLFESATAARIGHRVLGVLADVIRDGGTPVRVSQHHGEDDEFERLYQAGNLTRGQLLVWLDQQLRPESPVYTIATTHRFDTDLAPGRFATALATVVAETDALRTRFTVTGGIPRQEVLQEPACEHRFVDLSTVPEEEAEQHVASYAQEQAGRSLWSTGRVFDSTLFKVRPRTYVWCFAAHHLVFDGWSMHVLFRRLQDRYVGRPLEQAPAYAVAVAAERRRATVEKQRAAAAYWAGQRARRDRDLIEPLAAAVGEPGFTDEVELGPGRTGRLRAAATAAGSASVDLGIYQLVQTAVAVWWCRVHGKQAVWVGMPLHNRRGGAERRTVGLFMMIYPIRIEVPRGATVADVLTRGRAAMAAAIRHRNYTVRDRLQHRSFDVLVNYQPVSEATFDGDPYRVSWLPAGAADEALGVQFFDFAGTGNLTMSIQIRPGTADEPARRGAAAGILAVLDSLLGDPEQRVTDIDLLTAQQRDLVANLNDTAVPEPLLAVPDVIRAVARDYPDRVAVADSARSLTYRELVGRAEPLAHRLRELGAAPDRPVAIYADGGLDAVVAVVATLCSGGPYVPLDGTCGPERLLTVAAGIPLAALVAAPDTVPRQWPGTIPVLDLAAAVRAGTRTALPPVPLNGPAYVAFTSGSTGRPKGAMISHANLANAWIAEKHAFGLDPLQAGVHLQLASISFDVFTGNLMRALCSGATIVHCPYATKLDPAELYRLVEAERVTHAEFVPVLARALASHAGRAGLRMDSWRTLVIGSDVWTAADQRMLAACCGPDTRFCNSYGVTEATIDSTFHDMSDMGDAPSDAGTPIGRPMANQTVYLLDEELREVPPGAVAELYVGGLGVGLGYWGRSDLTATAFLPDPHRVGARMYRTGDLVRLNPRGAIEYLGRRDAQVKVRGVRLEPSEIEHRLRACPAIRDAAVTSCPGADGAPALVAYVVVDDAAPYGADLRRTLASVLPGYPVPERFVRVDRIPLTASGKPDRRALPAPGACEPLPDRPYRPPRTEAERLVAQVWCQVLERDRVNVDDNFFDLGGHSLLLMKVKDRLSEATGRDVPVTAPFQYPTVGALASYLIGSSAEAALPSAAAPDRRGLVRQRARRTALAEGSQQP